jgi:hypothetical protein
MFHMRKPAVQAISKISTSLGWAGTVVGPVTFGGVQFWASVELDKDEHERRLRRGEFGHTNRGELERRTPDIQRAPLTQPRPPLRLVGVLVVGEHPEPAIRAASYFAGYCPRAAAVPSSAVTVESTAFANLIDVALVATTASGEDVQLSSCGPRAKGATFNAREWHLLETVYDVMRRGASEAAQTLASL